MLKNSVLESDLDFRINIVVNKKVNMFIFINCLGFDGFRRVSLL